MQTHAIDLELAIVVNMNLEKILPMGYAQRRKAFVVLVVEYIQHNGQPCAKDTASCWDGHDGKVQENGTKIQHQSFAINEQILGQIAGDHAFRSIGTKNLAHVIVLCSNKARKIKHIERRR